MNTAELHEKIIDDMANMPKFQNTAEIRKYVSDRLTEAMHEKDIEWAKEISASGNKDEIRAYIARLLHGNKDLNEGAEMNTELTLRDRFAIAALGSVIANFKDFESDSDDKSGWADLAADFAYEYADAMLEARKR
jgi:hypothetical protein